MIYTLIAYRPNGIDSCRGCIMGRSDSDFNVFYYSAEDRQKLVGDYAQYLVFDHESIEEREICNWELTVLIDGMAQESFYLVDEETQIAYYQEVEFIILNAQQLAKTKIDAAIEQAAKQKLIDAATEAERKRNAELRTLKELQKKYLS